MIANSEENNNKKNKKDITIIYEDLKDTKIELFYNFSTAKLEYTKIEIGGEEQYKDIKKIFNNEIPKDDQIEGFIKFFEEMNEKFDNEYNQKNKFILDLTITGDKSKNSCKLECVYKLTIVQSDEKEKKEYYYRDFDIINNGTSKGFEALLYDLNHFSD